MAELGLRWALALRESEAEGRALFGESVTELIDRFNAQMRSEDFVRARDIIETLFKVDCYDDNSAQALDVQRTDLLCQCLDSYSLRLFTSQHAAMKRACDAVGMRDLVRYLYPSPPLSSEAASSVLRSSLGQAVERQAAVNSMCRRHSASQRFRRTWLDDASRKQADGAGGACSRAMQRFEKTLLQCFIVETQLRVVEAWFALQVKSRVNSVWKLQRTGTEFRSTSLQAPAVFAAGDDPPEVSQDWSQRVSRRHMRPAQEAFDRLDAAMDRSRAPLNDLNDLKQVRDGGLLQR